MKYVLLAALLVLVALSGVAWVTKPTQAPDGRTPIVWATDDNPRRRVQIDLFNQLHPQHFLRIDPVNNGLDKVVTQSLAGVGPDVFDGFQDQMGLLSEAGLLYDVTDQLRERGLTLEQLWPLSHPAISVNGRIFGIPCNVGGNAVWYHKDLFDAENIPYPPQHGWAWDEFVEVAKKLTRRDANGRVQRYGVMGMHWYDAVLTAGGRALTPDGRRSLIDSPEAILGLQRWTDLQLVHQVMPSRFDEQTMGTQGGWGSGAITLFKDKKVAMADGGRWWLCLLRDYKDASGRFPLNLGVAEKPVIRLRRFGGGSRVAYVNALSPNREQAVEFLLFLAGDAYSDQLNRDADALPATIAAAYRPSYDYDPNDGRDAGNSPVWREQLPHLVTGDSSPYITPREINRIIDLQLDLVLQGRKSVEDAARTAAASINAQIQQNLRYDPVLRQRYHDGDPSPVLGNFVDPAPTTRPGAP
jgi:multiple sugar transport system substrate-binding protein